jgi:hypothetical protein
LSARVVFVRLLFRFIIVFVIITVICFLILIFVLILLVILILSSLLVLFVAFVLLVLVLLIIILVLNLGFLLIFFSKYTSPPLYLSEWHACAPYTVNRCMSTGRVALCPPTSKCSVIVLACMPCVAGRW